MTPITSKENGNEKYPVVIYSHGLKGFQMESTVLCNDFASNGYIVVSIGHPYGSGAVTYTDGTIFIEPDDGDKEKTLQKLGRKFVYRFRASLYR